MAHPYELRNVKGVLAIQGSGHSWNPIYVGVPAANLQGEWSSDAMVFRK